MIAPATQTSLASLRKKLPAALSFLADLAFNSWWSWSKDQDIFSSLDPHLWQTSQQNPVKLLRSISPQRLTELAGDRQLLNRVGAIAAELAAYMNSSETWASRTIPSVTAQQPIAYFSIEYGLHSGLPLYSGGLGILAADHLKSASDLGLPLVAVGLFYHQGYCEQQLDAAGWQAERYPDYSPEALPLMPCLDDRGEPISVSAEISGRLVKARIWRVQVGRVPLYLLDTNHADNEAADRSITQRLYGGGDETRIAQEMLLGIGGVQALQQLGFEPQVYHLNEGHAAFALLELARSAMQRTGQTFAQVEASVRDRSVFTTHTPVPAGHDTFSVELMQQFRSYWTQLGLSEAEFLQLGSDQPDRFGGSFNMTALALRLCRAANGVSQLNGRVCREMWAKLYSDRPVDQVPIHAITNGIHARTWVAPQLAELYASYLGEDWAAQITDRSRWSQIDRIPNSELWQRHQQLKARLIDFVGRRMRHGSEAIGSGQLDPKVLTVGFARRFSTYKRGNLFFHDAERAKAILNQPERPVQLIFAGKAHPNDDDSKQIIQQLIEWGETPDCRDRLVFLENYDIEAAQQLIQGVDLWLNTPRRPKEASGTSGQKAALNGGIHCSVLDGWWYEAYQADVAGSANGWAIGEADQDGDEDDRQDQQDAEALYHLLETEIVPCYYDQDANGVPQAWVQRMKTAIQTIAPVFNTDRMVQEYVMQVYVPQA